MALTPGKIKGLENLSNDRGVIAAAAMDQRGSLKKALAAAGDGDVSELHLCITFDSTRSASVVSHSGSENKSTGTCARISGSSVAMAR